MPLVQTIDALDDPRIAGFRDLRERDLRSEGLFITEGALLAERLLQSRFPIESLLATPQSAPHFAEQMPEGAPLYVAQAPLLRQIAGFDFHRGVLGLGRRLPFPGVADVVSAARPVTEQKLIACPHTQTAENLGLILRSAAAFGITGVLLSDDGADPLSRRCLRQSMGSALSLPVASSTSLLREMDELRRTSSLRLVGAVAGGNISGEAEDIQSGVVALADFVWPSRAVLVLGNEFHGLDAQWLSICDDFVTIPLASGCDSLNVAVAAGVLLHHMSNASRVQSSAQS